MPLQTESRIENKVVMLRHELTAQTKPRYEYSFIGAIAIHQELSRVTQQNSLPSLSTINRILKKHGLTEGKHKSLLPRQEKFYPVITPRYPNRRHELDLVTPRYISGYGKIISVNRIDAFTHHAHIGIDTAKGADNVIRFLVDDWKCFGMPKYLQLDNEAAFRGGMYHARSFGKLIRFCLNFGVQMIFIPWKEPWRNPYIENFNGSFNRLLWCKKKFDNPDHLRGEARRFLAKHNQYQTYKQETFSNKTFRSHTKRFLPPEFKFNVSIELPITKGRLHFIRFVEDNGSVEVLNEKIVIGRAFACEYVWITIDTENQKLCVYHQVAANQKRQLVKEQDYQLREPVSDRIPIINFCHV